jgi:hypothetical protein
MRSGCWLFVTAALACTPAATPTRGNPEVRVPEQTAEPVSANPPRPHESVVEEIRAVVVIDAKPGGKKFQGVWLEREGGEKWVISYRPDELWRSFENRAVRVRGETYQPRGQAIRATHFRVDWLALVEDDPNASLVEVKEEKGYRGAFQWFVWPADTKLAGDKTLVFESGGQQYFLANRPPQPTVGQELELRAREVVPSPYVARPGGPHLWIVD